MHKIVTKFKTMGIVESIILAVIIFWGYITSRAQVALLRIRGYNIAYSVKLGRNLLFFQDTKHALRIQKNAVIGSGTRLKALINGQITIGEDVAIDDDCDILSLYNITIGKGTLLAARVYIVDSDHAIPLSKSRYLVTSAKGYTGSPITIGKYVWIGAHAIILKGVTIGDNVVIGAGAVVTKSIPKNCVAVGNPARVIKSGLTQ